MTEPGALTPERLRDIFTIEEAAWLDRRRANLDTFRGAEGMSMLPGIGPAISWEHLLDKALAALATTEAALTEARERVERAEALATEAERRAEQLERRAHWEMRVDL